MKSLIFGMPGQDSYFLSKLLLNRGDQVVGCHRHTYLSGEFKDFPSGNINFVYCDMMDAKSVKDLVEDVKPNEIYNLAAHSFINDSFKSPAQIISNNIISHVNLLESVRALSPSSKIYYAGSSEEINITSPYGVSKNAIRHLNDIYRSSYGMFIVHAQNFNHTSWRHSQKFLIGKVCKYVADLKRWLDKNEIINTDGILIQGKSKTFNENFSFFAKLEVGYLGAMKDVSYAEDVMRAAIILMKEKESGTVKVASGQLTNMSGVVDYAFGYLNLDYREFITVNKSLIRPIESITEVEDCAELRSTGWKPTMGCKELIVNIIDEYLSRGL